MASAIIHLCVAKKVSELLNYKSTNNFYIGSIAPDIAKVIGESRATTHFFVGDYKEGVPNINAFLDKYNDDMKCDFTLGYFIHLYTDKLWFDGFLDSLVCSNSIRLLDGTILTVEDFDILNLIYNDYTNLNVLLIDEYNLDLSLFYEEYKKSETKVTEVPKDRIPELLDAMGLIIINSREEKSYIFDLTYINKFIEDSAQKIYEVLKNINRKSKCPKRT